MNPVSQDSQVCFFKLFLIESFVRHRGEGLLTCKGQVTDTSFYYFSFFSVNCFSFYSVVPSVDALVCCNLGEKCLLGFSPLNGSIIIRCCFKSGIENASHFWRWVSLYWAMPSLSFIGRTDIEAETPIVWPLYAKSWLIWKDPHAGKDWGQEEKGTTEDEMLDGITNSMDMGLGGLW